MAIGRTFKEAFQKGLRALEAGRSGWEVGQTLGDDRLTSDSPEDLRVALRTPTPERDRKSTRLNSSHLVISYAVFCLKKKKCLDLSSAVRSSGRSARGADSLMPLLCGAICSGGVTRSPPLPISSLYCAPTSCVASPAP